MDAVLNKIIKQLESYGLTIIDSKMMDTIIFGFPNDIFGYVVHESYKEKDLFTIRLNYHSDDFNTVFVDSFFYNENKLKKSLDKLTDMYNKNLKQRKIQKILNIGKDEF